MSKIKPQLIPYSTEAIRAAVRGRAQVPGNMLTEALQVIYSNLRAKKTQFFTFQGMVTDSREVQDHGIQNEAAKMILQISDLMSRPQEAPKIPKMLLKIDPKTGTMSISMGDDEEPEVLPLPYIPPAPKELIAEAEAKIEENRIEAIVTENEDLTDVEPEQMQHIKVPRGTLPSDIRQALFGDDKPKT